MPKPFLYQIIQNQGALGLKPSRATSLLIYLASRQGSRSSTWASRETICKALGWDVWRCDRYVSAINDLCNGGFMKTWDGPVPNTTGQNLVAHFDCRPTLEKLKGLPAEQIESEEE